MGAKKPPTVLLDLLPTVHATLERKGLTGANYNAERLRRDRSEGLVPLPGRCGTTAEDAVLSMFVLAMARAETGHLCPAIRWYLLALNSELDATEKLRKQLRDALERVEKRGFTVPKLPTQAEPNFSEERDARMHRASADARQLMLSLTDLLAEGERRQRVLERIEAVFPETEQDPGRRSAAAAVRGLHQVFSQALGGPLSAEDWTRMMLQAARFDDQADVLRCLIAEREGITASVAHSARGMTDPVVVRGLLNDSPDELLRHTALVVLSRRRLGSVTCQGHLGRGCRPACDDVAWLLCLLLDPPVRRMWELHQGDVAWLVEEALNHVEPMARRPAEAVE
ncbi:hypothetical protein ACWC10_14900 [Streptomyces sp. NPDC001595]|uniref:hypothetical protein n=1 Tax=Streptomyces sp. NPDC001532 TaxID=3154520 RepID=UPI00331B442A